MKRLLNQWILFVAHKEDYHNQDLVRKHFQAQVALQLPDYVPGNCLDEI